MAYPPGPGQYPQQPQYPGQLPPQQYPGHLPPQYQYPQQQGGKKTGLWIGLGVVVVVLLVVVGVVFAVALSSGSGRSGGFGGLGGPGSGKSSLAGKSQSDYAKLLPVQSDFGSDWKVADSSSSADSSGDGNMDEQQKQFLSKLNVTPAGCGLADMTIKFKSLSSGNDKLAGVKGTKSSTSSSGSDLSGSADSAVQVSIDKADSFDNKMQAVRDYISKCPSATMQGDLGSSGVSMMMVIKFEFKEVPPPQVAASKVFAFQMHSSMSMNGAGQNINQDQLIVGYVALVRGVLVSAETQGPDSSQQDLAQKLFQQTVDRANNA